MHQIKITQLADDTTLFLKYENEIPTVIKLVEEFGKHSQLKLNKFKTKGLLIGNLKTDTETKLHGIQFRLEM